MFTSKELRDEAARLIGLDEDGARLESMALALRIGESSLKATAVLHELDIRTVETLFDDGTRLRDRQADGRDPESETI
jgi:hypothetical protein